MIAGAGEALGLSSSTRGDRSWPVTPARLVTWGLTRYERQMRSMI